VLLIPRWKRNWHNSKR